jgi:hypothetical protein
MTSDRLPILGSRGCYLVSRPNGWHIVTSEGEADLGIRVLTDETLARALCAPRGSVRVLSDAVEVVP